MRILFSGLIVIFFLISFSIHAQINKPTPEVFKLLSATQTLQSGSGNTQSKFVLLDFWATWCGPCIAALPGLQNLQEKYKDSLQVISVSDEKAGIVQRYLFKKNFKATSFVCDTSKSLFRYFDVDARPAYFLLNTDGEILWTGQLEILDSLLPDLMKSNRPVAATGKHPALTTCYSPLDEIPPIFSLRFNITAQGTEFFGSARFKEKERASVKMQNTPFIEVISYFMDVSLQKIVSHRPDLDSLNLDLFLNCDLSTRTVRSVRDQVMANMQQSLNFRVDSLEEMLPGYESAIRSELLEKYRDDSEGGGFVDWKKDSVYFWRLPAEIIGEVLSNHFKEQIAPPKKLSKTKYSLTVAYRPDMAGMVSELEKSGLIFKRKNIKVMKVVIR